MAEQSLPAWEKDPLSTFLFEAEFNTRVTALNCAPLYDLMRSLDGLFRKVEGAIENDNREALLVSRFLIVRTHSSFLAGIRLAMSGQVFESCPVLRSAVEQAWYALHIAKDPTPPTRAEAWLNRNIGDIEKGHCKSEFTVAAVKGTHEKIDPRTAQTLHEIYERLIDFGARPNQFGVMAAVTKSETDAKVSFGVGILHPEPLRIAWALKMASGVAIGALKVFLLVFPERFALLGIDRTIEDLLEHANNVFKPYSLDHAKAASFR